MYFGIHVHTAGATWFDAVAKILDRSVRASLAEIQLSEVDGLYIGFSASSRLSQGLRKVKKKIRRDYTSKVLTGGVRYYKCVVEFDAEVSDAELVAAADTEASLFSFVQRIVLDCLPMALRGFEDSDLAVVQSAVSEARLPHESRW